MLNFKSLKAVQFIGYIVGFRIVAIYQFQMSKSYKC